MPSNRVQWQKAVHAWPASCPEEYKQLQAFASVLDFVDRTQWQGACHATTAVLTVLLREQGIDARPFIGECKIDRGFFDHSWVEIDSKVYDVAIAIPLIEAEARPPVFAGLAVDTRQPTSIQYGVKSPSGFDEQACTIKAMPFAAYMDGFPNHPDGLWGVVKIIGKEIGLRLNGGKMKATHSKLEWCERA